MKSDNLSSAARPAATGSLARRRRRYTVLATMSSVLLVGAAVQALAMDTVAARGKAAPPPNALPLIIAFPERDMVDVQNVAGQAQVSLAHKGATLHGMTKPAGATAPTNILTSVLDPKTGVQDLLINHPGTPLNCWNTTPAEPFNAGDVITVSGAATLTMAIADVTADYASLTTNVATGVATVKGHLGPGLDKALLEARMIGGSKLGTFSNGRRDIRVPDKNGLGMAFAPDATGTTWTATFSGLTATDISIIRAGAQVRGLWRNDPVSPTQLTIYEANGVTPGAQAPCTSPFTG